MLRTLLAAVVLPLVAAPQTQIPVADRSRFGNVHVVDASGGGAHTTIQAAISAALAGDTVLVRSGQYAGFTLSGKGLSIVGEVGATVVCQTASRIELVPLGQRALVRNVEMRVAAGLGSGIALVVANDAGAVRIEDCVLAARDFSRQEGLFVTSSPDVILRGCALRGGGMLNAGFTAEYAGPGGSATGSVLAAYESTFEGGDGGSGHNFVGGSGGAGWRQSGGTLRVERSSFQGGDGGESLDCQWGISGDGGPGLRIDPPWTSPVARAIESTFSGGAYGMHACGYAGNPGSPVVAGPGTFSSTPGPARSLAAAELVRDGTTLDFSVSGLAGESAFLLVSARDARATSTDYEGVLFASPRYVLREPIGTLVTAGTLHHAWNVPADLVPDGLSITLTAQAVLAAPTGAITLSNPVTIVVLDQVW